MKINFAYKLTYVENKELKIWIWKKKEDEKVWYREAYGFKQILLHHITVYPFHPIYNIFIFNENYNFI